jgi:hypothetical protein
MLLARRRWRDHAAISVLGALEGLPLDRLSSSSASSATQLGLAV